MKVSYVCTECGSNNVMWDAWAKWDEDTQEMYMENYYDHTYCNNCDGECSVEEVVIDE